MVDIVGLIARLKSDQYVSPRELIDAFTEQDHELERLRKDRLKIDRRIRNQRRALRDNWEIVEMRRKWLGSDTARRMYCNLLVRHRKLLTEHRDVELGDRT